MWREGAQLNLERALRLGDELGGHIVTGHVDAVGEVVGTCPEGDSTRIGVACRASSAPMIAAKGSITLDGVSLTVNEVRDAGRRQHAFRGQHHSAHGAAHDASAQLTAGQQLNVEIDVLARYLDRMIAARAH